MSSDWFYYVNSNTGFGVEWNPNVDAGSVTVWPKVYRYDAQSTANTGGTFTETLKGNSTQTWTGIKWGSGSGTRLVDTFSSLTFNREHSDYDVTLSITAYNYGSWYSGSFHDLGTVSHTFSYTIPAKDSYTVSFDANGGTGAPSSQTKWNGETLTLSSTAPTRTGYAFMGWATSASATTASYSAGDSYDSNSATTLYAVWQRRTWTVSYDANGGSGAPASQTKTYGTDLTLSSTVPTRSLYVFQGWATSATGTPQYAAGDTYANNADATLYASWKLDYLAPTVTGLQAYRCDASGNASDIGTYAKVAFSWSTYSSTYPATAVTVTVGTQSATGTTGKTSGSFSKVFSGISAEQSYAVTVTVSDKQSSTLLTASVPAPAYHIDFSPNFGVGLGGAAKNDNATTVYRSMVDESGNEFLPWQKLYPVGSIYLSYVSTSPASLFGGSWTQITGRFLRAANDVSTGGADTHTLTISEMPPHQHQQQFSHTADGGNVYMVPDAKGTCGESWEGYSWPWTKLNGGGEAHNNMPAYQDVYAWRRVS